MYIYHIVLYHNIYVLNERQQHNSSNNNQKIPSFVLYHEARKYISIVCIYTIAFYALQCIKYTTCILFIMYICVCTVICFLPQPLRAHKPLVIPVISVFTTRLYTLFLQWFARFMSCQTVFVYICVHWK